MSLMRIYELSKQLKISNKELLEHLPELGIVAKNHASSIGPDDVKIVIKFFKPETFERKEEAPILEKIKPEIISAPKIVLAPNAKAPTTLPV
ncbi:TPA: hypothetical protein DEF17_07765, partial [bacterium]|nr:hypothetical protein [bacterium]